MRRPQRRRRPWTRAASRTPPTPPRPAARAGRPTPAPRRGRRAAQGPARRRRRCDGGSRRGPDRPFAAAARKAPAPNAREARGGRRRFGYRACDGPCSPETGRTAPQYGVIARRYRVAAPRRVRDLSDPLAGREVMGDDAADGGGVKDEVEHGAAAAHQRPQLRASEVHADEALQPARSAHRHAAQLPYRAPGPVRADEVSAPHR